MKKGKETCSESTDNEDATFVNSKIAVERCFGSMFFAVFPAGYFDSELGWAGKTHTVWDDEPVLY